MSADNYKIESESKRENSIFALKVSNDVKDITGYIYYFNKFDDDTKTIQNLHAFNKSYKNIHIIVYNYKAKKLSYYHPLEYSEIGAKQLNKYDKCIIINIKVKKAITTYIFLSEERNNQIIDNTIFKGMKPENKQIFEANNLFNIVKALFNIIEDYNMNIGSVPVAKGVNQVNVEATEEAQQQGENTNDSYVKTIPEAEYQKSLKEDAQAPEEPQPVQTNTDELDKAATRIQSIVRGNAERKKHVERVAKQQQPGGGKRKYKTNVNQKSLKKMSTIIKKLLKINLNIKPVAKPKAKPVGKPTTKPKAKPVAKPATKPKAKK